MLRSSFLEIIILIKHTINWVNKHINRVEYVCCLYATAPFVESIYLIEGYEKLINNDVNYTFSVTSFPFPIQRAIKISTI